MAATRKKKRKNKAQARKPVAAKRGKARSRKAKPASKARPTRKAIRAKAATGGRKVQRKTSKKITAAGARTVLLEVEEAELLESLKKNPHHHRLPPEKRHEVPEDEGIEREGVKGRVFVEADTKDEEAQQLGEEFVRSVTSGEEAESEMEEEAQVEEQGGPFVITTAREEYAYDSDESNPPGTEREPFPRVSLPVRPKAD